MNKYEKLKNFALILAGIPMVCATTFLLIMSVKSQTLNETLVYALFSLFPGLTALAILLEFIEIKEINEPLLWIVGFIISVFIILRGMKII